MDQPTPATAEQAITNKAPSRTVRIHRNCLFGFIFAAALFLIVGFVFINFMVSNKAEVTEMGPWPGPDVSPGDVAQLDLSHLGLEPGVVEDVFAEENFADSGYEAGKHVTYQQDGHLLAEIWALRYQSPQAAADEYHLIKNQAQGNCGIYQYAIVGSDGMIQCAMSDGYIKFFLHDCWLVEIQGYTGDVSESEILVDRVRDAMSEHWKSLELK